MSCLAKAPGSQEPLEQYPMIAVGSRLRSKIPQKKKLTNVLQTMHRRVVSLHKYPYILGAHCSRAIVNTLTRPSWRRRKLGVK